MKKVWIAITLVTLYLVFFQAALLLGISIEMIFAMLAISPFLVIGMVYIVLKHGEPSKFTFDERFYDDFDYQRNGKEQLDS